jgi:RNA polymerase sigma-70 factor (ECF subfamily)
MDTDVETDEDLAARMAKRDESARDWASAQEACRELYERHARRMIAFLAARVRLAVVEDIHQEVWQKVWQSLPTAFHGGSFRSWLYTIARNCITDHLRRRTSEIIPDERNLADSRHRAVDEELVEAELREVLAKCLQKLEQRDSQLADLVRSRVQGESYEDFCARTGMPADRAYRAFHQAKAQLQECVERQVNP